MRLTKHQRQVIKQAVAEFFGPTAIVKLFGSRADDTKKGGDIDLFIISPLTGKELQVARLKTMTRIQMKLGDQKIDIVTAVPGYKSETVQPVVLAAEQNGVAL